MRLRCAPAGFVLALFSFSPMAIDAAAQDSTVASPKLCWRGRPKPSCDMFLLTEVDFFGNVVRPSATFTSTYMFDSVPRTYSYEVHQSNWKFSGELGGMINHGKSNAFGGTLMLDAGPDGVNVGAKARYRRWLTPQGIALDVGAGVRTAKDDVPGNFTYSNVYDSQPMRARRNLAFTSDVAINAMDYAALVARVDVEKYGRKTQPTVSLGVRTGSRPAVFALAGIGVTYAALLTILVIALGNGLD